MKAKRGVPTDQQIRELLGQYYTMKQQPRESVADFSHRFSEVQHELEKLIPGIHRTTDGTELELIHAFSIKLLPHISKEIISRDFKFSSLQELITVAARYEQNILIPSSPDTGHSPPGVLFSQPTVHKQGLRMALCHQQVVLVVNLLMMVDLIVRMVDLIVRIIAVIITFNYVAVIAHTRFAPYTTNLLSHAVNWQIINVFMVDNISVVSVGKWAVRHLNIGPNKLLLKPM